MAEHNKALWVEAGDGQPWLNTGDLGRQDREGYFYLNGRKKELIIRGGHNIDPAIIEQPLHQHPAVLLAAAIGRPDAHAGEVPVAYVQLKPGADASAWRQLSSPAKVIVVNHASEADLLPFVRKHIGERAAVPKAIRIVAAMPLTGVGKIFKPELKLRETEHALSDALLGVGIALSSVSAQNDPAHGIVVSVEFAAGESPQRAQAVLAQFPFSCQVAESIGWRS